MQQLYELPIKWGLVFIERAAVHFGTFFTYKIKKITKSFKSLFDNTIKMSRCASIIIEVLYNELYNKNEKTKKKTKNYFA
jgi:hypothetical protein